MTQSLTAANAPIHVSKVGLKARDADGLAEYYKAILGFAEVERTPERIVLGVASDGQVLLEIERAPSVKPDDPRSAGLFHTAFLLPDRADLARWVRHATERRIRVDGASDHLVSEALYLTDPEGTGIEIYADRPSDTWPREGDGLAMATDPLDFAALDSTLAGSDTSWQGAPQGSVVGHVHLRVGDSRTAENWWRTELGFDTTARYGTAAVFLATGGYHHHIGANAWRSAGAGRRDADRAGLSWVELRSRGGEARVLADPWGTEIRVVD